MLEKMKKARKEITRIVATKKASWQTVRLLTGTKTPSKQTARMLGTKETRMEAPKMQESRQLRELDSKLVICKNASN